MANANDQAYIEQDACNGNITAKIIDKIKTFNGTESVYQETFGLELQVVQYACNIKTVLAIDDNVSWIEGVLPFYSVRAREKNNSKNADFLGYLLNRENRCQDSYVGRSLREFACFLDNRNQVQVVVPWLGQDYVFVKPENRIKIVDADNVVDPELEHAEMGIDMCHDLDATVKKIPCAATTYLDCIDDKTYNKSICYYSKSHNKYYKDELPDKLDLDFID